MGPMKAVKVEREIDYDERLERRLKRRCISNQKTKGNTSSPSKSHVIIIDEPELEDVVMGDRSLNDGNGDKYQTSNGNGLRDKNNIVDGVGISRREDDLQRNSACHDGHCSHNGHSNHNDASTMPTSMKKNAVDGVGILRRGDDLQRNNAGHDGHCNRNDASTMPAPRKEDDGVGISRREDDVQRNNTFHDGHSNRNDALVMPAHTKKNVVDISRWEHDLQRNNASHDGHSNHNDASTMPTPTEKAVVDGADDSELDEDLQTFLNIHGDGNGYHTPKGYPSMEAVPNKKNVAEAINISEPDDDYRTILNAYHGGDRSATFVGSETDEVDKDYLKFLNVYCDGNADAGTTDPGPRVYPDDTVVTGAASPEIHVYSDDDAVARTVDHDICVLRDDVFARNSGPDIHNSNGIIEDLEDPQYKLFLQNLRIDKKSYVVEVEVDDGITLLLKYECEEFNLPSPENYMNSTKKDKVDVARGPSSVLRRKDKFFETVKEKMPSKRSEMNERSAPQMCMQRRESLEHFEQAVNKRQQMPIEGDAGARKANFVSAGVKKTCNLGPRQETFNSAEDEEEIFDESYATFLHFIRSDGEVLVLDHNGERVRYEEDSDDEKDESSSDVMIIEKSDVAEPGENIPGNNPYTAINLDDDECGEVPRRYRQSQFREKLLDILRMPYDAREHADLHRKIAYKRPKTYVRRLRNGMEKAYPAEGVGKSYLDLYTDLAEKLGLFKENRHKTLNLLRGFFYWLNNLPTEGVFRPWLDPACLNELPST